jgi:hypothetical protein
LVGLALVLKRKERMKANIEIPVADLKPVLPGLSKIVSKRASLPVLGCVKLTLNPDRTLHIQANDLDQIVTARLNKPFTGKPGEMLVPFDELSKIAKRCAATDTIELSVDGKETSITYPAAGTRIKKPLQHLDLDEFPLETVVNTEPVQLDNAFKEAFLSFLGFASQRLAETRFVQLAWLALLSLLGWRRQKRLESVEWLVLLVHGSQSGEGSSAKS